MLKDKIDRRLILKDEFIDDLLEAMNWYDERRKGLAENLYKDTGAILTGIETHPESFSTTGRNYRQALLNRFPYLVIYKIYKNEIVVYALFHTARNPKRKIRRK